MEKLAQVNIEVPHRAAGNIIRNKWVHFDVFRDSHQFKAVPLCREDERVVANLPPELLFEYLQGQATSPRGIKEGNQHLIDSIVDELKKYQHID